VLNKQIAAIVKQNTACDRLTRLEGVGPISSVLLYATLGTGEAFANDKRGQSPFSPCSGRINRVRLD